MKKIVLSLLFICAIMAACNYIEPPSEPEPPAPAPSEPASPATREFDGIVESWQDDLLVITDANGVRLSLNTAQAVICGRCLPHVGYPVTVTVAEQGPSDLALQVWVQDLPADVELASRLLAAMDWEEKVGQMFLARCPEQNGAQLAAEYHLGGYVLFARDFAESTPDEVRARIASYQQAAGLPLYIAVDEEGGVVVRVSRYAAFRSEPFPSPQSLYRSGGMEAVTADAAEKGRFLQALGINVDLAPVADVSTSPQDFIYDRALGEDAVTTAAYVAAVVEALEGAGVSATLKHFPGYGSNGDTHNDVVRDYRSADTFYQQDLLPFQAGIAAGADFVLVSHNIVAAFDGYLPASVSPALHRLLREELDFDGLIITDDLAMEGVARIYGVGETAVLAVLAGNDMLLSSDPEEQIPAVLAAVESGRISEDLVDAAVERILLQKIASGLIPLPD